MYNKELLEALNETLSNRTDAPIQNEEVEALKKSLKIIDAETEQIIQKMDALR